MILTVLYIHAHVCTSIGYITKFVRITGKYSMNTLGTCIQRMLLVMNALGYEYIRHIYSKNVDNTLTFPVSSSGWTTCL